MRTARHGALEGRTGDRRGGGRRQEITSCRSGFIRGRCSHRIPTAMEIPGAFRRSNAGFVLPQMAGRSFAHARSLPHSIRGDPEGGRKGAVHGTASGSSPPLLGERVRRSGGSAISVQLHGPPIPCHGGPGLPRRGVDAGSAAGKEAEFLALRHQYPRPEGRPGHEVEAGQNEDDRRRPERGHERGETGDAAIGRPTRRSRYGSVNTSPNKYCKGDRWRLHQE